MLDRKVTYSDHLTAGSPPPVPEEPADNQEWILKFVTWHPASSETRHDLNELGKSSTEYVGRFVWTWEEK